MAFDNENFLVVEWNGTPIISLRFEENATHAADTLLEANPDIDVWNIKLQTNRNAASLHKTELKSGSRDATREEQMIRANGIDVGETEVTL